MGVAISGQLQTITDKGLLRGSMGRRKSLEESQRYQVVYRALVDFAHSHSGASPTVRGLTQILRGQMSYSTVWRHVNQLVDDGLIERVDGVLVIRDSDWHPPAAH
jgi:hypothetical protein